FSRYSPGGNEVVRSGLMDLLIESIVCTISALVPTRSSNRRISVSFAGSIFAAALTFVLLVCALTPIRSRVRHRARTTVVFMFAPSFVGSFDANEIMCGSGCSSSIRARNSNLNEGPGPLVLASSAVSESALGKSDKLLVSRQGDEADHDDDNHRAG